VPYNWEFSRRYGPMINGTDLSGLEQDEAVLEIANRQ